MVIGKVGMAANGKPPISEIAEKRVRIAETAERIKGTYADFVGGERGALAAEAAVSKQSSRSSENRILIELTDRLERSLCRFGTGKHDQIGTTHSHYRLPQLARPHDIPTSKHPHH